MQLRQQRREINTAHFEVPHKRRHDHLVIIARWQARDYDGRDDASAQRCKIELARGAADVDDETSRCFSGVFPECSVPGEDAFGAQQHRGVHHVAANRGRSLAAAGL